MCLITLRSTNYQVTWSHVWTVSNTLFKPTASGRQLASSFVVSLTQMHWCLVWHGPRKCSRSGEQQSEYEQLPPGFRTRLIVKLKTSKYNYGMGLLLCRYSQSTISKICQHVDGCMILDNFSHLESINGFYIEKVMMKVSKILLSLRVISQLFWSLYNTKTWHNFLP